MQRERRLVDRVLRLWRELAHGGRFPSRDQIEPSVLGEDWANCLVIAVHLPVQLSQFLDVGDNLSGVRCPNDNLAGVLLSHLSEVLSERRCLMIEGRAASPGRYPLSERPLPAIRGRRRDRPRPGRGKLPPVARK